MEGLFTIARMFFAQVLGVFMHLGGDVVVGTVRGVSQGEQQAPWVSDAATLAQVG